MFYLVNLTTNEIESKSDTLRGCANARDQKNNADARRGEHSHRFVIDADAAELDADDVERLLHEDPYALDAFRAKASGES